MKRTDSVHRAHELEVVVADTFDGFANRHLYTLDSLPGLYRRLPKPKKGEPMPDQAIKAFFQEKLILLARFQKAEQELKSARFVGRETLFDFCSQPIEPYYAVVDRVSFDYHPDENSQDAGRLPEPLVGMREPAPTQVTPSEPGDAGEPEAAPAAAHAAVASSDADDMI